MLKRIRSRVPGRGHGPWILVSSLGVALLVTPFAVAAGEGRPLDGGARNPSNNASQAYTKETEIIANTSSYGTRQSNKSNNGGGAVYGCRSGAGGTPANNEPCIRANNLSTGLAFEYAFEGTVGGTIDSRVPGESRKPFTTNATGVATGLNADRVDSKSADDIKNEAVAATQARFAAVNSAGTVTGQRGVSNTAARTALGTYRVSFSSSIENCALQATINGTAAGDAGIIGAAAVNTTTVEVSTRDAAAAAADRPFHLTVTC